MAPKKEAGSKATKKDAATATYELKDVVLGKVKGFPAWPGMVIDPDSAPENVKKEQPKGQKTTVYCIRFFPTSDHAWLSAKDISRLLPHEIDAFLNDSSKKNSALKVGYEVAKDPESWEKQREEEAQEDEDEDEENQVDELDEDSGKSKGKKKPAAASKKRKREAEPAKEKKPAAKKATATKAKAAPKKGKGGKGQKSKETVESEDDGDAEADADEDEPTTKKSKKDEEDPEVLKVKEWRHKLQKGFLGKEPPNTEAMDSLDALLKSVEQYDSITLEQLQQSKIGKVMRHIAALSDDKIPKDADYNIRNRADALVQKWSKILPSKGEVNGAANGVNGDSTEPLSAVA